MTPDYLICPECGEPTDNGHDRCLPPNPYVCSKCEAATPHEHTPESECSNCENIYPGKIIKWDNEQRCIECGRSFAFAFAPKTETAEWEAIDDTICQLLIDYGPDGHIDGHDEITAYIVSLIAHQRQQAVAEFAREVVAALDKVGCVHGKGTEVIVCQDRTQVLYNVAKAIRALAAKYNAQL